MENIIIYTNETCPYCKTVKEEFKKENIDFEERVGKQWKDRWTEIINLTGMATVPTIEYNNEYFVAGRDFGSPQQLVNRLNNYVSSPYEESKRTFEMLKTLNYNIHQAFMKMDQLLRQIEINTKKE